MKNDIEALRWFANSVIDYFKGIDNNYSYSVMGYASIYGLIDKNGFKTEILTGSKETINDAQRRLYFMWINDVLKAKTEEFRGYTKEDLHWMLKERFLIPIFYNDDSEFRIKYNTYVKVFDNNYLSITELLIIKETFLGKLSINDADKDQAQRFLNDVEMFFHQHGIVLKTDSALYRKAIGL